MPDSKFIDVYHAASHQELALLRMALERAGVRYFVKNEYATLGSRSAIGSDQLAIMVEARRAEEARALVRRALAAESP